MRYFEFVNDTSSKFGKFIIYGMKNLLFIETRVGRKFFF